MVFSWDFHHLFTIGRQGESPLSILYLYDTILHLCDTYTCIILLVKPISALYRMNTQAEPGLRPQQQFIRRPLPPPSRSGFADWPQVARSPFGRQKASQKRVFAAYGPVWVEHKPI